MRGPEARFWKAVRDRLPRWARGIRVEANRGEVESGTPDVVLSAGKRTRWIELKVYPEGLRDSQVSWALSHDQAGCDPVLVLVKRGKSISLLKWYDYGDDPVRTARWDRAIWSGEIGNVGSIVNYL